MSTSTPAPTPAWRIVAEREIRTKLRARSFQFGLAGMAVAIIAVIVLFSVLGGRPSEDTVAVIDSPGVSAVEAASVAADNAQEGSVVTAKRYESVKTAEQAVRDGDVDAALLPAGSAGYEIIGENSVGSSLAQHLSAATATAVLVANADSQGVDLNDLRAGTQVGERLLDPDAANADQRRAAGFVFVILFYITAITFGMTIAQSVVQEKESRVVEILAAAISVRALLWGKVVGTSLLALGQVAALVAVGVIGLAASGMTELLSLVAPAAGWGVVFFALGFVALAGMWAVAGSLASRTEDLQSTTMPGQVLLFVPYLLAVTGGEAVKTVVSMVPIGSAMMMPVRLAEGSVPAWQLAVAVVGNLIAIVVLVRIAAHIYERTLMRTERKISYKEAFTLAD